MKEIIATAKTVDEAIEKACQELSVNKDDVNVSIEILEMPQKKLFRSIPAKVKVSLDEDSFSIRDLVRGEDKKKADPPKQKPQQNKKQFEKPVGQPAVKPIQKQPIKPQKEEKEVELDKLPNGAKAALEYLQSVASCMGATKLTYKAVEIEKGIKFLVDGEDSATLIGRRGDVMDSLQYLCLLVSNRADEEYCKITFDVANYRNKRAGVLESLATKVAIKVKKTRRNQTLEPMNPYERRIIHSTIQEIDGVRSESVGFEPNRRVVVIPEGGRANRKPYNNSNNRSRYNDRPKKDFSKPQTPHTETKPETKPENKEPKQQDPNAMKNLYGKIEF